MLLSLPAEALFDETTVDVIAKGDVTAVAAGSRCIPVVVDDDARHDNGEDDGGCSGCCPRAFVIAEAETAEDDVLQVVVEIDLLLSARARYDDVNRTERVVIHTAHDAILYIIVQYGL